MILFQNINLEYMHKYLLNTKNSDSKESSNYPNEKTRVKKASSEYEKKYCLNMKQELGSKVYQSKKTP